MTRAMQQEKFAGEKKSDSSAMSNANFCLLYAIRTKLFIEISQLLVDKTDFLSHVKVYSGRFLQLLLALPLATVACSMLGNGVDHDEPLIFRVPASTIN